MLTGKNEVLEWIELNDTPFWNLRRTEKGSRIFVKSGPENLTIAESREALSRLLDMLDKGTYHIDAWGPGWQNNQWLKSGFRVGGVSGSPEVSGIGSMEEIEARVMEKLRKEMEFERLKTRNAELESEINSVNHRVSKKLEPFIPQIIQGIFGTKIEGAPAAEVAGIQDADVEVDQERLEKAFEKWYTLEKEVSPVDLVEKIVQLAETNPAMYDQAKKMLMD